MIDFQRLIKISLGVVIATLIIAGCYSLPATGIPHVGTSRVPTLTLKPSVEPTNVPTDVSPIPSPTPSTTVYRAFTEASYWNTPIPFDAPIQPNSDQIIKYLEKDSSQSFVRFSGLDADGQWGRPIYWGYSEDPIYQIICRDNPYSAHVPTDVKADPSSDAAWTLYDMVNGWVLGMHDPLGPSMWCSSIHVLSSNGLDNKWTQFTDTAPENSGHRGAPASNIGIRVDEIEAGAIDHKLHLSVNTSKNTHVFPMVGDENGTQDANAPPEGVLIRIKPSVDLESLDLSPAARIVATALQTYGAIVGDQSGGPINLKVENTIAEGRGNLWRGVLTWDALKNIPMDPEYFEVIEFGYGCGDAVVCAPVERE